MHMTIQPSDRTESATWRWRQAMLVGCLLFVAWRGAAAIGSTQASPGAEANQLHAAIVNGDVESVRYWLEARHADPSSANASEPDVTPLERCLGLAARVLDVPPAGERGSREIAAHAVSLRVLQDMVMLLHEHGAWLTDADRQHFSGAVLRWYDDAVSPSVAPPQAKPAANPTEAPASSSKQDLRIGLARVAITIDSRASCNGSGHAVYLVNETQLSVTAVVTRHEDGSAQTASRGGKSDSYTVDPGNSWRLGCDTATDGHRVRYELTRWR
jgi:hypothetical protein